MTAHATTGAEVDLQTSSEGQGLCSNAAIAHVRTENNIELLRREVSVNDGRRVHAG